MKVMYLSGNGTSVQGCVRRDGGIKGFCVNRHSSEKKCGKVEIRWEKWML